MKRCNILLPLLFLPLIGACGPSGNDTSPTQGSATTTPSVTRVERAEIPSHGFDTNGDPVGDTLKANIDPGQAMAEALANELSTGMQAAFDEHAQTFALGGTPEQIAQQRARFDETVSVSAEDFQNGWQAPAQLSGKTYQEIVEALMEGSGLTVDPGAFASAWKDTFESDLNEMSRVQALETVAASANLIPIFVQENAWDKSPAKVTFEEGPRAHPVSFAGPFLIEVKDLTENAPYSTGNLHLIAYGLGLSESVIAANQAMAEWFVVESVQSSQGDSLVANPNVRRLSQPNRTGNVMTIETQIELASLLLDVDQIARMPSQLSLRFPTAVHDLSFLGGKPEEQTLDDLTVNLTKSGKDCSLRITGGEEGSIQVLWAPENSEGQPLGTVHQNSFAMMGNLEASLTTSEPPARIGVKVLQTESNQFNFSLDGIVFEKSSQQPKALTELKFEQAQPVSVVFVDFEERESDFPKILLRSINHANKDVKSASIKISYLDDKNKSIEDSFLTLSPAFDFQSEGPQSLVAAGDMSTAAQPAFFMPKNTVSVQIVLQSVEFMDSTSWKAEPK